MKKPAKREYMMVLCAALAVVYGLYTLLFASTSSNVTTNATSDAETLNQFTLSLAKELDPAGGSKIKYILEKAAAKWAETPFLPNGLPGEDKSDRASTESQEGPEWRFSGYLEMAGRRLAVINGLEYAEGEQIEDTEYYLVHIGIQRVELGIPGSRVRLELSLDESVAGAESEKPQKSGKMRLSIAGHEF